MPGVRYGPDIADDAAAIYKGIRNLNEKEEALKRRAQAAKKAGKKVQAAKLSKKDQAKYDRLAKLATDIFGVTKRDLKRGKYGDVYKMQRYSTQGVTKKGAPSKGAKLARNKRTKKIMKRSETTEFSKRSEGKTTRSDDPRGKTTQTYLGLTKPKGYRDIEDRAYKRMQSRGGVRVGRSRRQVGDRAGLDKLGIARVDRVGGVSPARNLSTRDFRPPLVKKPRAAASAKRASSAQRKTKKNVRGAGRAAGKKRTSRRKR